MEDALEVPSADVNGRFWEIQTLLDHAGSRQKSEQ